MTTLTHETSIEARPADVWAVLADLPSVANYNDGVLTARWATPHHDGVGAARICRLSPKGEVTEEVTLWEPDRALGLRVVASPWPLITSMKWTTHLQPRGGHGTTVVQDLTYNVGLGPVGRVLDILVLKRKLASSLDGVFANLKTYVEKQTS